MNKIKLLSVAGFLSAAIFTGGCATDGNSDYSRVLNDVLTGYGETSLTQGEIASGLKEALTVGSDRVVTQLATTDGYFGDDLIRIPLPEDLQKIQKNLAKVGLSGLLDDLDLKINRAAESAAPTAKKLVVDAVSSMTIDDALGILNGGNTAATDFLKAKTSDQLISAFRPYMDTALAESGAVSAMDSVGRKYLPSAMVTQLRTDLETHAVNGALDGMFYYLAQEEKAIREDPVKRTTELLRRVFGG